MSFATLGVTRKDGALLLGRGEISLTLEEARVPADRMPGEVIVGVRPEHAHLWAEGNGLAGPIAGRAEYVEMLGRETLIGVTAGGDQRFTVLAGPDTPVRAGERLRFGLEPGRLHLFDAITQQTLGTV